jgi:hypothetical protein
MYNLPADSSIDNISAHLDLTCDCFIQRLWREQTRTTMQTARAKVIYPPLLNSILKILFFFIVVNITGTVLLKGTILTVLRLAVDNQSRYSGSARTSSQIRLDFLQIRILLLIQLFYGIKRIIPSLLYGRVDWNRYKKK